MVLVHNNGNGGAQAFVVAPITTINRNPQQRPTTRNSVFCHDRPKIRHDTSTTTSTSTTKTTTTSLFLGGGSLIDVPDGFFTITFPLLGIMLQISKQINRARLEERAFDLRVRESREAILEQNPFLTELDLIKQEAASDISYYGPDAMKRRQEQQKENTKKNTSRNKQEYFDDDDNNDDDLFSTTTRTKQKPRVQVVERLYENGNDQQQDQQQQRRYTLSEDEILELEAMGVMYDPYYDDPYTEEELPGGSSSTSSSRQDADADGITYRQDKRYGDRIYSDGEVFYKDAETGLYFRQGAKPRSSTFWTGRRD